MQPLSEAPPLPLFAYGTLVDAVFTGRLLERRLAPEPAVLLDHALGELPGLGYPVVVPAPGRQAEGVLYRHLTAADFDRLDAYEGVAEGLYARGRAEAVPASGGAAEPVSVYLPTDRALRRYR
ncbi:MAG: gamma-glutamylcyclotransferase family protein [Thermoanaerobaculia bacterium]